MKYTLFGESHGSHIGIVLENVPAGLKVDFDYINFELNRRSAKNLAHLSTTRHESDEFAIISGYFDDYTTGAPLCALCENKNIHTKDYEKIKDYARPSHADFAASIRYNGYNDYRGGGHFSGRLTAPLVFGGALAKQFLAEKGIEIYARVRQIADVCDEEIEKKIYNTYLFNMLKEVPFKKFPSLSEAQGELMQKKILEAKEENDSVGGIIECFIFGLEAGFGAPTHFQNLEGILSQAMFAVPAVKGIEFGLGFNFAKSRGSKANDAFYFDAQSEQILTKTNNNGGINGGISNGMPINFSLAIKPTPSIGLNQESVDLKKHENINFTIEGRHDPCIVPRAVPVIEAAAALAISRFFEDNYAK